jgi:hypothetical protein
MCFLCSCWKGCILCFLSNELMCYGAWFVLLNCCVLLCRIYLVKWNHPFHWYYDKVKFLHTNHPGYYRLHGGSIYIYIILRPDFLIYINIRTLPLKHKVVGLTSHKRQATIQKVGQSYSATTEMVAVMGWELKFELKFKLKWFISGCNILC